MKIRISLLVLLSVLALASCSTEMKLAKRFVEDSKNIHAAVYFPEQAKVTVIPDEEGRSTPVLDSLDQDYFLDIMYVAYAEELTSFGVDVYIPEDQDNVPVDSMNWLVVLTQMEIQGQITPYQEEFYDMVNTYEYTVPLNTVNVAAWFDINDGDWLPTQFYEYNLMDDFTTDFGMEGESLQFRYAVDTIAVDDIYNYAVFLGRRYADYTYSTMMNKYIRLEMLKGDMAPRFRLRWDPKTKSYIYLNEEEGFIEISSF